MLLDLCPVTRRVVVVVRGGGGGVWGIGRNDEVLEVMLEAELSRSRTLRSGLASASWMVSGLGKTTCVWPWG
jgi:hypothetical protein